MKNKQQKGKIQILLDELYKNGDDFSGPKVALKCEGITGDDILLPENGAVLIEESFKCISNNCDLYNKALSYIRRHFIHDYGEEELEEGSIEVKRWQYEKIVDKIERKRWKIWLTFFKPRKPEEYSLIDFRYKKFDGHGCSVRQENGKYRPISCDESAEEVSIIFDFEFLWHFSDIIRYNDDANEITIDIYGEFGCDIIGNDTEEILRDHDEYIKCRIFFMENNNFGAYMEALFIRKSYGYHTIKFSKNYYTFRKFLKDWEEKTAEQWPQIQEIIDQKRFIESQKSFIESLPSITLNNEDEVRHFYKECRQSYPGSNYQYSDCSAIEKCRQLISKTDFDISYKYLSNLYYITRHFKAAIENCEKYLNKVVMGNFNEDLRDCLDTYKWSCCNHIGEKLRFKKNLLEWVKKATDERVLVLLNMYLDKYKHINVGKPEYNTLCKTTNNNMSQIDSNKLIEIYALPKNTLHKKMVSFLSDNDYEVSQKPGEYIYAKPKTNELPILLSAHMDTINDKYNYGDIKIDEIVCNNNIISVKEGVNKVLGGDDRNGVYLIKKIIEDGFKPYVILTHDEETNAAGVRSFLSDFPKNKDDIKLGIAIDRGYKVNKDDPVKLPERLNQVVFYEENSAEVHSYFESKGFVKSIGSNTDIKKIGATSAWNIAYANITAAYCWEHSPQEVTNIADLQWVYETLTDILKDPKALTLTTKKGW